jgi:hypothetical protein
LKLANTSLFVQYDDQEQLLQAPAVQLHHLDENHNFTNQSHSSVVGTCRFVGQGHLLATLVLVVSHHKLSFFGLDQSVVQALNVESL